MTHNENHDNSDFQNLKRELDSHQVKNLPPVRSLCDECAKKIPIRVGLHPVVFCAHNRAGAFYTEATGIWTIIHPVELAEFGQAMGIASAVIIHNAQAEAPPEGERH